jgi:hypothetical protein
MPIHYDATAHMQSGGEPVVKLAAGTGVITLAPAEALDMAQRLLAAAQTAMQMKKIPESVSQADLKAAAQGGSYLDQKPAA